MLEGDEMTDTDTLEPLGVDAFLVDFPTFQLTATAYSWRRLCADMMHYDDFVYAKFTGVDKVIGKIVKHLVDKEKDEPVAISLSYDEFWIASQSRHYINQVAFRLPGDALETLCDFFNVVLVENSTWEENQ